ncbi:zinc finger, CCHC-type containing protein [Tanacetum coccineum]
MILMRIRISRGIFKDIFPRLYALESSKDVTVSSKIGDTSFGLLLPWNWNLESTGIFSVASARRRIDEICLPNIGEETRWVKCVPIKINVLAWKIKTDALPTRFNISRRGIDIQDMSCPICDNAIESTDHLFFRCGLVRDIANKVLSWWNLDHANLNSYAEWKSWLVSIRMDSKLKKMFEGVSANSLRQLKQFSGSSEMTLEKQLVDLRLMKKELSYKKVNKWTSENCVSLDDENNGKVFKRTWVENITSHKEENMRILRKRKDELYDEVSGKVRFEDGSYIEIKGKGSILIECDDEKQRIISHVYYIPDLKSNLLSLGQFTEIGCKVVMEDDELRLYDMDNKIFMKVTRQRNRLYKANLRIGTPVCLLANLQEAHGFIAHKTRAPQL